MVLSLDGGQRRAEFVSLGLSRLIVFMLSDIALYIPACYPLTCGEYAYARELAAKKEPIHFNLPALKAEKTRIANLVRLASCGPYSSCGKLSPSC